ncbi:MAG TPA: hypothetical protein VM166_09765, partial [Gemmatimonadaceae bacterium]|nr:hypothetical protein [Gemmatimonadaceae bacterium]
MTELGAAEDWFASQGWRPFAFQRDVWRNYLDGCSGLIHAATGTGKTLSAWWGPLLEYIAESDQRPLAPAQKRRPTRRVSPPLRVLWITPLRAL